MRNFTWNRFSIKKHRAKYILQ